MSTAFPVADPIPLPAPVWLFKVLLDTTLVLHFASVFLLLGGLLAAVILNALGHKKQDPSVVEASGALAGWLPIVMTYVINLGIPPLLFAQVLYGRALYTSSVLIAAYWIAVIPLLIAAYHLLYVSKARAADARPFVWPALGSLTAVWLIARIYTANMTLMLEPSVWREAYHASQSGSVFLTGPASWARWGYMLASGITGVGVLAAWLSTGRCRSSPARDVLQRVAFRGSLIGAVLAGALGVTIWSLQTEAVQEVCNSSDPVWLSACGTWIVGTLGLMIFAPRKSACDCIARRISLTAVAILQVAGYVVCRDLVRDASLSSAGFDVWDRAVAVNWSVLGLFLVLFVIGLGVVGWLASIAYRSAPARKEMA